MIKKAVITTDKRGVFFGSIVKKTQDAAVLKNAQMCVYWSSDVKGVLGLASTGPTASCRTTKPIPEIELNGVTSVMDVTKEAANAWEKCPWG